MPKFYTVPVPRGLRQKLGLQGSDIRTGFLQLRFHVLQLCRQVFTGGGQAGYLLEPRRSLRTQLPLPARNAHITGKMCASEPPRSTGKPARWSDLGFQRR